MSVFVIEGRLPGLNEYIASERSNRYKAAKMKRDAQALVCASIRGQLHGVHYERPVRMSYLFIEPNKRRDHDNVASMAIKVIQDALVVSKVLNDDGWNEIAKYDVDFGVDKKRPRIIVTIEEVPNG